MARHQQLWPSSFREGALCLQLTGFRLLGERGNGNAPPESYWLEVLTYLGRDWFEPVAAGAGPEYIRPPQCVGCGTRLSPAGGSTLACVGCRAVRFCSKGCLKEHWKGHRQRCKKARKRQEKHDALESGAEHRCALR